MPVNGTGQGNSPNTPVKQRALEYFLRVHAGVVSGIVQKYPRWTDPHYYYIDANAGTGKNADGTAGSVLIAHETMAAAALPLIGTAIEKDYRAFLLLQGALYYAPTFRTLHADNAVALVPSLIPPTFSGRKYGLVYCDPNGVNDFPFDALVDFFQPQSPTTQRLDLLVSIGANHLKRCRAAGLEKYTLTDIMQQVPKQHWYIREGYWKDQWTFLFGTNWDHWPELNLRVDGVALRGLQSLGMYKVGSVKGQAILAELSDTQAEAQKKSPQLPIAPTGNTWHIPVSSPFGGRS
jgi:hypothetical protein